MIAEQLGLSNRSYWQMVGIPDLPTSGPDAISELVQEGLVTTSFLEGRIEPTPAFWPWLEGLRAAEAQGNSARETSRPDVGRQLLSTPAASKPSTSPASPALDNRNRAEPIAPAAASSYRPRVKRLDLEPVDQVCTKILAFIQGEGGCASVSQLKRGLNSYRFPQLYDVAIQKLLDLGAIRLEKEPGTRRQRVCLIKIPNKFKRTGPKPKRGRRRPANQRRTPWFEKRLLLRNVEKMFDQAVQQIRKADSENRYRAGNRLLAELLLK